jgi:hypothetical protein
MSQRRDHLRAADVDRTYVAEILKRAVDEGRLSLSEYDDRLVRTYEARTYGDLDKVILDLPRPSRRSAIRPVSSTPPVPGAGWSPPQQQTPGRDPDWLRRAWAAWAIAVSVNVVVWLIVSLTTAEFIYPWPLWVAGPWGAVLLVTTFMNRGGSSGRA